MDNKLRSLSAAVALVTATPVAVWWVVGDQSSRGFDDLDYMVRPLPLPPAVESVAGALAAFVAVAAGVVLYQARQEKRITRGWLATPVLLCASGALLAVGWRVVTAGVIGANIGGGLFLLLGLPAAAGLAFAAGVNAWWESRR